MTLDAARKADVPSVATVARDFVFLVGVGCGLGLKNGMRYPLFAEMIDHRMLPISVPIVAIHVPYFIIKSATLLVNDWEDCCEDNVSMSWCVANPPCSSSIIRATKKRKLS